MEFGLNIECESKGQKTVLRLRGRIDAATSGILEKEIQDNLNKKNYRLTLDFFEVDYLSSAGMRVLLSAAKKIKAQNGSFSLFGINEEVMEIIKMAGFDKILRIFSTEKEAISAGD